MASTLYSCSSLIFWHLLQLPPFDVDRIAALAQLECFPPFILVDSEDPQPARAQRKNVEALKQILSSTKTGLRVVLYRHSTAELERLAQLFEDRGVQFVRLEEGSSFSHAIAKMEEILAEEERAE